MDIFIQALDHPFVECFCMFWFQLVSNFQMEAEVAKNKLSSVRKMIAKLLKSINEVSAVHLS